LFRQTGDPKYLEVSRCARKAAHTLYRHLCREGEAPDGDGRFLRLIR
jgi:hypothetical protein